MSADTFARNLVKRFREETGLHSCFFGHRDEDTGHYVRCESCVLKDAQEDAWLIAAVTKLLVEGNP